VTGCRSLSADTPVTFSCKCTLVKEFIVMEALSVILVRWSCVSSSDEYQIIRETLGREMKEQPVHGVFAFIYSLDPEIGVLIPY